MKEFMDRLQNRIPGVMVFRRVGDIFDVPPEYYASPRRSPQLVAEVHWRRHRHELSRMFPAEIVLSNGLRLPRSTYMRFIWIETINEVNRGSVMGQRESEWWAEFAYHTAQLAMRDGFNWATFSWSTGEPESLRWQGTQMRRFLELAANNPERIAIALHEHGLCDGGSRNLEPAAARGRTPAQEVFPDLVGYLRRLYGATDYWGLPRPTVLITQLSWPPMPVPSVEVAIGCDGPPPDERIPSTVEFYAQFPEVLGATIWYLGSENGGIAREERRRIEPLAEHALQEYSVAP